MPCNHPCRYEGAWRHRDCSHVGKDGRCRCEIRIWQRCKVCNKQHIFYVYRAYCSHPKPTGKTEWRLLSGPDHPNDTNNQQPFPQLFQSAVSTIDFVAQGSTVVQALNITFFGEFTQISDAKKVVASQQQWADFITPYLNLDAGQSYSTAMTA